MKKYIQLKYIIAVFVISFFSCSDLINDAVKTDLYRPYPSKSWTVMAYLNGDNSLEANLKSDISEMTRGVSDNSGIYLIVMFDGYDYGDTVLYDIRQGQAVRIKGRNEFPDIDENSAYEADMGDAGTLKQFIRFCKKNYPAENYALFMGSHGNGVRGQGDEEAARALGPDKSDSWLYNAEITDVLTADESVNLFAIDACYMGTCEVAYQYRPGNGSFQTDVFVSSAASELSSGWDYESIFSRIRKSSSNTSEDDSTRGGNEQVFSASSLTPLEFGSILVEEMHDSAENYGNTKQTLVCCDLTKIADLKAKVDELAVVLDSENEKTDTESIRDSQTLYYFDKSSDYAKLNYPHYDIVELCEKISLSEDPVFSTSIKAIASGIISSAADVIKYSYGGSSYTGFQKNTNGLAVFFPYDGNWSDQVWYHPYDMSSFTYCYGKISWCKDGATENNGIENWFELLDSWYDSGDVNSYSP